MNKISLGCQLKLNILSLCETKCQWLEVACGIFNGFERFGAFPADGQAFVVHCISQLFCVYVFLNLKSAIS